MEPSVVFESLVPLLVDAVPRLVSAQQISKPLCRLRLYYYDTHAPCTYVLLALASVDIRTEFAAKYGEDARRYLWADGCEEKNAGYGVMLDGPGEIQRLFAQVYELLCESEEKYMIPFRTMLQRVAWELNLRDWRDVCPVTDDFVVIPADGSVHFGDFGDIIHSIPSEKLHLLRSRGLGPPDDWELAG